MGLPEVLLEPWLHVSQEMIVADLEPILGPEVIGEDDDVHPLAHLFQLIFRDLKGYFQNRIKKRLEYFWIEHEIAKPVLEPSQILTCMNACGRKSQNGGTIRIFPNPVQSLFKSLHESGIVRIRPGIVCNIGYRYLARERKTNLVVVVTMFRMNAFNTPGISVSMRSKFLFPTFYRCPGKDATRVDIQGPKDSFVYLDYPHHSMANLISRFNAKMFL